MKGIVCGRNLGAILNTTGVQIGQYLNQLLQEFAFWSKESETDYYASLEDDSTYISLTEKQ